MSDGKYERRDARVPSIEIPKTRLGVPDYAWVAARTLETARDTLALQTEIRDLLREIRDELKAGP